MTLRPSLGRVTSFDARRGLGIVTDSEGATFDFHATAIVDGSRLIESGVAVTFSVVPGHRGRYEARGLIVLPGVTVPSEETVSHHEPA